MPDPIYRRPSCPPAAPAPVRRFARLALLSLPALAPSAPAQQGSGGHSDVVEKPASELRTLLQGSVRAGDAALDFTLSASSRADPVGGVIVLGDRRFVISRVSVHNLIGAVREGAPGDTGLDGTPAATTAPERNLDSDSDGNRAGPDAAEPIAEYVIFSSSFSQQTATGTPWLASQTYHRCDQPYNSFLALYRVSGRQAIDAVAERAFSLLPEDVALADDSAVYCFVSAPPG